MIRRFATVVVIALVAVLLPMSAASAGVAVGTVTNVTSAVNERTPLYHLELTFQVANVQCPAVVDYEMRGDTLSAPVDQCTGDPDGFFATATATTMRPMFGNGLGTINPEGVGCDGNAEGEAVPGCQVDVFVRDANAPVELVDDRLLVDGDDEPIEVTIPPRPVWVGVGDGYTSRVTQMADWCFEASPDAEAAGQDALGTANVFASDYSEDDPKYDYVECQADVPGVHPITGFEEYVHPVTGDIYYFDRDTETLWRYDWGNDTNVDPGDVVLDDLERTAAADFFKTGQNVPGQSWITSVVQTFNDSYQVNGVGIPCSDTGDDSDCWFVVPEVIAEVGVSAADLAATPDCALQPDHQLCQLEELLTSDRHQGSWNWIGLSAGLLDAGIPQAIQAQYPTDVDDSYLYESPATGYVPWRPAAGDPCPALPTISPENAAQVTAGITNVIEQGMAWSPGLKSIVVRYPWLTEVTPTDEDLPATNPCAPGNRAPITAVNEAVDAAIAAFPGSDDVFQLNLAADLDLSAGFTDEPTDSVPGRPSFLQLTRPYGYPYPSDYGSSSMGTLAYASIDESGLQPPTIEGVVVQADDDDPLSPSSVADALRNSSGWYRAHGLYVEWQVDAPEGIATRSSRSPLLRGLNRTYSGTVVDSANQSATASATVSWDPDAPIVASTLSGGTYNSATGWYRSRPTINWVVTDPTDARYGGSSPSGVAVTPPSISTYADGRNQLILSGVASDVAGNTATGQRTLSIDTVPPVLDVSVPNGGGWSNATSVTVVWHRSDSTSGVAGISSHPNGYTGGVHSFPSTPVTAEGLTQVSHTVTDMAGHATSRTVDVRLDKTAPQVYLAGDFVWPTEVVPQADLEGLLADIESRGCDGIDVVKPGVNTVSGYDRCTLEVDDPEVVGTGMLRYTVTMNGWDKADNKATVTKSFTVEVTDPPTLTGAFVTEANGAGWWKTDVQIDWEATPEFGIGLHPLLGDLYTGNWSVDGTTGVGTHRSTHADEGIYTVQSPSACNVPQPGGACAPLLSKSVKLDKTAPYVHPAYDSESGSSGWFRGPVTVSWDADDAVPGDLDETEVSGLSDATLPEPTVAGEGVTEVSTGEVTDRAGNTTSGSVTVKVDSEAPEIEEITGVTEGKLYNRNTFPDVDDVTCTAVDKPKPGSLVPTGDVSGVDDSGCKVARLLGPLPTSGPPIREVTWQATATDVAGNVRHFEVVTRFLDAPAGEGLYAIFSEAPDHLVVGSGIQVRGTDNNAYVYSGHTGNGTANGTRAVVNGAADIEGDYHAQGGVLVEGSAQIRKDLLAKGDVVIRGNATIHGDVITTGSITLDGSGKILGNAVAGGSINIPGGGSYIDGDATAGGSITHPTWSNNFVRGVKTPNSPAAVSGPTAYSLPAPPVAFDGEGWPQPYRHFETCAAFNSSLNEYWPLEPSQSNRNDFRGTYFIAESGCTVAPGGDSHTLTLTGPAAIVAKGCIETKGSAKFQRPAGSASELWLVSLHDPADNAACSGAQQATKGIRLAGGSVTSVPTLVYAKNESRISGSVRIWGQIWGKRVVVDGGFQQDFKPFLLPCFTGLLDDGTTNCPVEAAEPEYSWPGDGTGVFVIGDSVNSSVGKNVYFWGSQWRQNNPVTGSTHNSFKGYETNGSIPTCGGTWTTRPGNSSNPPDTVPRYMAVVVSSHVDKSGSTLSGDVKKIVVVDTANGYSGNPGHPGTGKVVRVLCG